MVATKLSAALFLLPCIPALAAAGFISSTVQVFSSNSFSELGQPVTLSAVVAPSIATGRVTFYSGTSVLGVSTLFGGEATLTTILLSAGTQSVRAYYSGDATYRPAASASLTQTVSATVANGFTAPVNYTAAAITESIAIADFNGDGRPDLAVSGASSDYSQGSITILLGNGDGTFLPSSTYNQGGGSIVAADFNGDGNVDLATSSGVVLLGNGDGTFGAVPVPFALFGGSLAAGDFNGDGVVDLVLATAYPSYKVSVFAGNGDGTFQQAFSYSISSVTGNVVVADFNNDGKADIAICLSGNSIDDANVGVLLGNGDGTLQPPLNYDTGGQSYFLAVGDFNGDGKADLVSANNLSPASVFIGNGDGTFQTPSFVDTGTAYGAQSVAVGDINGDGVEDLVFGEPTTGTTVDYTFTIGTGAGVAAVLLGNRDGTFQPPVWHGAGDYPSFVAIGEFNRDGRSDLAVVNSDGISVLPGTATAAPQVTLTSSLSPAVYGQTIALTATVSPPVTGGTIAFMDSSSVLATVPVVNGSALLSGAALQAGGHVINAFYYSSTANAVSVAVLQKVTPEQTTITLASSANPSVYGQVPTLIATVSPATASGTVSFNLQYVSSCYSPLGSAPLVAGVATLAPNYLLTSALLAGNNGICAVYSGDSNHTGSTANITQIINPAPTTTTLTSAKNPSNFGQSLKLTAMVSPPVDGTTLTFYDGTTSLGIAGAGSGTGSLTVSTLSTGTHSLTVVYAGDNNHTGSTSPVLIQNINPPPAILPSGVVSAVSPTAGFASGTWVAIYGTNLAQSTRTWAPGDFIGNNLPTTLDGVSVTIAGIPAYVYYVSSGQLNVLAPQNLLIGHVAVQVTNSLGTSAPVVASNQPAAPAFFTYSQNPKYAIAEDGLSGALLAPVGLLGATSPARPAAAGEVITLYAEGLGETTPPYTPGQLIQTPVPVTPLPQVTIGGILATVQYAGLIEAGLYQINLVVPSLPTGDASLVLSINGAATPGGIVIPIQ